MDYGLGEGHEKAGKGDLLGPETGGWLTVKLPFLLYLMVACHHRACLSYDRHGSPLVLCSQCVRKQNTGSIRMQERWC